MDEEINKEEIESEEKKSDDSEEKIIEEETPEKENSEEKLPIVPKNKEGKIRAFLRGKKKEGSWKPMIIGLIASMAVLFFWENPSFSFIKAGAHAVLDPSVGFLLNLNLTIGMIIIVAIISLFTTLVQKYCTDQETLKELRKEQKILQDKSKEFRHHPEKMMEIQKEISPLMMKTMKLSMRAVMFTSIPFVLFFRWFRDFFSALGDPKFFGFLNWIWFYLIAVMIFSSVFRKLFKVV